MDLRKKMKIIEESLRDITSYGDNYLTVGHTVFNDNRKWICGPVEFDKVFEDYTYSSYGETITEAVDNFAKDHCSDSVLSLIGLLPEKKQEPQQHPQQRSTNFPVTYGVGR